jgi:hypothetical protein
VVALRTISVPLSVIAVAEPPFRLCSGQVAIPPPWRR